MEGGNRDLISYDAVNSYIIYRRMVMTNWNKFGGNRWWCNRGTLLEFASED
jgi:hypothetical protein